MEEEETESKILSTEEIENPGYDESELESFFNEIATVGDTVIRKLGLKKKHEWPNTYKELFKFVKKYNEIMCNWSAPEALRFLRSQTIFNIDPEKKSFSWDIEKLKAYSFDKVKESLLKSDNYRVFTSLAIKIATMEKLIAWLKLNYSDLKNESNNLPQLLSTHSSIKVIIKAELVMNYLQNQGVIKVMENKNITYDYALIPQSTWINSILQYFVIFLLVSYLMVTVSQVLVKN